MNARSPLADPSLLVQHLVAGVVVHTPTGEVVQANPKACELLGQPEASLVGRGLCDDCWRFCREDGSPMPVPEYPATRVIVERAVVRNLLVGVEHPDGLLVWVLCNAYFECDPQGGIERVVVMLLDVSERVAVERALRGSEHRYRLLYEHSYDAVLITGLDGQTLSANPAACEMFGLSQAELVERGRAGLVDFDDPRAHALLAERRRLGHVRGRLRLRRGDGSLFEAEISSSIYPDPIGMQQGSVIVRDVSQQLAAEAALAERNLAAAASRAKTEFIAKMSHELRTPLNAVLGLTEVLLRDPAAALRAIDRQRVQHVLDAGTHLLGLIEDLLDLSAVEGGSLTVSARPVELGGLVRRVVEQCRPLAARRDIAVDWSGDGVQVLAQADPGRLRQVLWNLLSNAIKYNRPGGRVTVDVRPQNDRCEVCVADTGVGMDAAQRARLFRAFERLGREHGEVAGLGIGLALSRHLVELMGGDIEVESTPGQGSVFRVRLPAADAQALADGQALPTPTPAPAVARRLALRILVVDDDPVNRLVMEGIVSLQPDCSLLQAADGQEALALARQAPPPDLLLIDLMMPGMDGAALLRHLRGDPLTRAIPCIAVSAHADKEAVRRAREAGFDGYLAKPVTLAHWHAEVERVLAERGRA